MLSIPYRRFKKLICPFILIVPSLLVLKILLVTISYDHPDHSIACKSEDAILWNIIEASRNSVEVSSRKYLVNNKKCQIPEFDVWDSRLLPFLKNVPTFECKHPNITYVKDQHVIINEETLLQMGYHYMVNISCCYYTIHRVQVSRRKYDSEYDDLFQYFSLCRSMERKTKPVHHFILVVCKLKSSLNSKPRIQMLQEETETVYENFHVIAMLPTASKQESNQEDEMSVSRKISFWKSCASGADTIDDDYCKHVRTNGRPPNVILLGMDSTSGSNFYRFMNRTRETLLRKVGAIDFKGYTKVGENTFPNFIPLMTSLSVDELTKLCWKDRSTPLNDCPFIWKDFSDRGYLTAFLEDQPNLAIVNHLKKGFLRPPTDFYLRPFMLAAYKKIKSDGCIGYQRTEEIILDHVVDLATLSESNGVPYFLVTWMSQLTHDDNMLHLMDTTMDKTLQNLLEKGLLENTVLLIMGDHGYRYTAIRETIPGWYEDKLPALFIKIPDKWINKHPLWLKALNHNANQLTTPYNVHAMLRDIYRTALNPSSSTYKKELRHSSRTTSLQRLSLLKILPYRSCEEAGVPKEFCACYSLVKCPNNLCLAQLGAQTILSRVNEQLPSVCMQQQIIMITAFSALIHYPEKNEPGIIMEKASTTNFVISLITHPGNFSLEAVVTFSHADEGRITSISSVQRKNKIDPLTTQCLDSSNDLMFETFCYCNTNSICTTNCTTTAAS